MINKQLLSDNDINNAQMIQHGAVKNENKDDENKQDENNKYYDLAVATRVHFKHSKIDDETAKSFKNKFELLCRQIQVYSNLLLVAIDGENEKEIKGMFDEIINEYKKSSSSLRIEYIIITPWLGYTAALNAIIRFISIKFQKIKYLSFQSLEISQLSVKIMEILIKQMDDDTLVVGPSLMYQHKENDELLDINGGNIPWNTINIWNINKLKPFGFQLISDGIIEDVDGGIEEVVTISLIQYINGQESNKCKLIMLPTELKQLIKWDTNTQSDSKRKEYHDKKIASKVKRASKQLSHFKNLPTGKVMIIHIEFDGS